MRRAIGPVVAAVRLIAVIAGAMVAARLVGPWGAPRREGSLLIISEAEIVASKGELRLTVKNGGTRDVKEEIDIRGIGSYNFGPPILLKAGEPPVDIDCFLDAREARRLVIGALYTVRIVTEDDVVYQISATTKH